MSFAVLPRDEKWWIASRKWKALKIIKVLNEETGTLKDKIVLDLGCSTGIITKELSDVSMFAVGVDLDRKALKLVETKKNLGLLLSSGLQLPFKRNAFDVVCCNQMIEYIPNKERLAEEIYRILKPGGLCYLGAVNKLVIMWLDLIRKLTNSYFKTRTPSKGEYDYPLITGGGGRPCTYWGIKRIFHVFGIKDRTPDILKTPDAYFVDDLPKFLKTVFRFLPTQIVKILMPFSLSWVFILRRPGRMVKLSGDENT